MEPISLLKERYPPPPGGGGAPAENSRLKGKTRKISRLKENNDFLSRIYAQTMLFYRTNTLTNYVEIALSPQNFRLRRQWYSHKLAILKVNVFIVDLTLRIFNSFHVLVNSKAHSDDVSLHVNDKTLWVCKSFRRPKRNVTGRVSNITIVSKHWVPALPLAVGG